MRYDLTVANTSNVPLESFFWHDKIPYDVARPTTLTTGTYSARLNYRILYKTNYNVSYQVLASNLLTSNNYSFALNAIPMQAGEVVTDIYFDFGKVPVGFQSVVNPTLSVMVNGNAVNGYQMVFWRQVFFYRELPVALSLVAHKLVFQSTAHVEHPSGAS